jgi:hypothetical protein
MREPVSKKEPVPVVETIVEIIAAPVDAKKRTPAPLDEDGWRVCARMDCGLKFKPDTVSRAFCSEACAAISFYRDHGMALHAERAEKVTAKESSMMTNDRRAPSEEKDAKYGPLRTVGETLSETRGAKRVKLVECGHVISVAKPQKQGRCRVCRNAAARPEPKEEVKRTPVPLADVPRVAKEPVAKKAAPKPTRKPVKKAAKKPIKKKPAKKGKR